MAKFDYQQIPYGSDNYAFLIHDPETGATACVDAGDGTAIIEALRQKEWELSELWITHHHGDHTDGLMLVKDATGCKVRGPGVGNSSIDGLDETHGDGDSFVFAGKDVQVIHTPGHTTDMINFYLPDESVVFTGDTLFVMGCGRVFEGDMDMMWNSLKKLRDLPKETLVYCSHEYTNANAQFALTVDPDNVFLQDRARAVGLASRNGIPTIPTTLADELTTNPFLRPDDKGIRAHLGMQDASDSEVFAEIRTRKDNA